MQTVLNQELSRHFIGCSAFLLGKREDFYEKVLVVCCRVNFFIYLRPPKIRWW